MKRIGRFLRRFFSRFKKSVKPSPYLKNLPKFDDRTEKNLATLLPEVQPEFRKLITIAKKVGEKYGVTLKVISGTRTWEEQDRLYSIGRTTEMHRKPVTNVRGGFSRHNHKISGDFGIFRDGKYLDGVERELTTKIYRSIWNEAEADGLKIIWGGNWKSFPDPPHFEYEVGKTMAQIRSLTKAGKSIV
tara:strand:- start:793 stop:1356 length:564 start_codon:yes stop_codon:yes gene_type:complete